MNKRAFLDRLDALGRAKHLTSERAISLAAGLGASTLRNFRTGQSRTMTLEALQKLADVLEVSVAYLIGDAQADVAGVFDLPKRPQDQVESVSVVGEVEAGVWREAATWDAAQQFQIAVPRDVRYLGLPRFALQISGLSMDRLYPHGSIVVAVQWQDGWDEKINRRAVIVHHVRHGLYEATCKMLVRKASGERWLEPRSTDNVYKPIRLPDGAAARDGESIEIVGLVTGAYIEQR